MEDQEFSSSDALENNYQEDIERDVQDTQDDSDSESSTSGRQNVDAAFDIITGQSSPPHQDTVDFIVNICFKDISQKIFFFATVITLKNIFLLK